MTDLFSLSYRKSATPPVIEGGFHLFGVETFNHPPKAIWAGDAIGECPEGGEPSLFATAIEFHHGLRALSACNGGENRNDQNIG
jgi:hypothetical protein